MHKFGFSINKLKTMSQDFKSMTEAFEWFMGSVYPSLSTEQKRKLKDVKYNHYKRAEKGVSKKRMQKVLNDHGYSIEHIVRVHSN